MVDILLPQEFIQLEDLLAETPEFKSKAIRENYRIAESEAKRLLEMYKIDKYRIVFIGEPGKGKTTAICNWINLLRFDKSKNLSKESCSLLATATGRTTVAEVRIKQTTTTSKIRIEYLSHESQLEHIREYAKYYYRQCMEIPDNTDDPDEKNQLVVHLEIERVVRNMSKLPNPSLHKNEAKELVRRYTTEEDFFAYVVKEIDLDKRQRAEIIYNGKEPYDVWLSETFKKLNNGEIEDCAIPGIIHIDVAQKDLNLDLPEYVGEIIDTIGLDSSNLRQDLSELIEADDTIIFLMDVLTSVPSPHLVSLMKNAFITNNSRFNKIKCAIFVKSPESELKKVNDANDDPDQGMELKRAEIESKVNHDSIPYLVENTLFLDSCNAYLTTTHSEEVIDSNGNPVIDERTGKPKKKLSTKVEFDEDNAAIYRYELDKGIRRIISNVKKEFISEAGHLIKEIHNLKELEKKFEKESKDELVRIHKEIDSLRSQALDAINIGTIVNYQIAQMFDNVHWRRIRKLNELFGDYEDNWYDNYYDSLFLAGAHYFRKALEKVDAQVNYTLRDVRNEVVREMTESVLRSYNNYMDEALKYVGTNFKEKSASRIFAPRSNSNTFWYNVNSEYGRGYTQNIRNAFREHLGANGSVYEEICTEAVETLFNKLLDATSSTE